MNITEKIKYVGVNDKTLDLFESQYKIPNGVSYNSYIIQDEKITIMDTVDKRAVKEWLQNIEETLEECTADYLVVSHLEPDHSAGIEIIADKYPEMKIVLSKKASEMNCNHARRKYTRSRLSQITIHNGTNGTLARSNGSI